MKTAIKCKRFPNSLRQCENEATTILYISDDKRWPYYVCDKCLADCRKIRANSRYTFTEECILESEV